MKKLIIFIVIFFAFGANLRASHVSAADLTYECLGGLTYKFTLKLYRDCGGQSVSTFQNVLYSSTSCSYSSGFLMNLDTFYEVSQVCDSLIPYTNCNSGSIQGIEVYIFTKTVTLLGYCNDYVFSRDICCRSSALVNLSPGLHFYTETKLNNLGGVCNDSPIFKAVPILYTCFNEVVNFNNLAFDPEGDSLSYQLVRTFAASGVAIPYTNVSFSATNPFATASGVLFDSVTGQMSFTSNVLQQVMATVLITEYDTNGNVKGSHLRDLHFIIINCPPPKHNPYTTGVNFDTLNYTYNGCFNQPLDFDVYSVSFDSARPIILNYFSNIPGATFTTRISNDTTFGRFSWSPGNRLGNYYFNIQTLAKTCPLVRQNTFNYKINLDTFFHECVDTSIFLPFTGSLTIDSSFVLDINTAGICNTDSVVLSKSVFSCPDTGQNIVTVTTYYSNGLVKICDAIVTVYDSISPYAACMDTTIYLNSTGHFTIDSGYVHDTTIISCGTVSMVLDKYNFNCGDLGPNQVSVVVTEISGLKDTCQAIVTVRDSIPPVSVCKDTTVYLNSLGQISIDSTSLENGSSDNCGIASIILSKSNFECSDLGRNVIWMIVQDIDGNKDSCQGTVTVMDTIPPSVNCKDTTLYLNSSGSFTITNSFVINGASDNCIVDSIWLSKYNFGCSDLGMDSVYLFAKDGVGNSDTCRGVITILDTIPPIAICRNISVYLSANGNFSIDSSFINNGSSDNCQLSTITLSQSDFNCADLGANSITMIVSDPAGNVDSCTSIVTVIDTVKPIVICMDTTIYIDSLGTVAITSNYIDNGSNDSCGVDTVWLSKYVFDCFDTGKDTITMYVKDGSGNMDSCQSIITIIDTVNPLAICKDTTIYLSPLGTATIDSTFINNNLSYGCDVSTITLSQYNYTCSDIGINSITMLVTDINGNQNSCQSNVTVLDTTRPTAICRNITVYLPSAGIAIIDSSFINNRSSDNCNIVSIKLSDSVFNCNTLGANIITMTVSDSSGNLDSCQATVTVIDTMRPVAICMDTTAYIDSLGTISITTQFIDNGSYDNCGLDSVWLSKYDFNCNDAGLNNISLYVLDSNGNIDSCQAIVTIVDTVNPIANCKDTTIYLSMLGTAIIDSSYVNHNLNSGCDIVTVKLNQYNYDCSNIGLNSITMTVTDFNGNQDSCQSIVTVLDTNRPIAICQNITVYLSPAGFAIIDSSDINNGSTDNCAIRTIKLSDTSFNCLNLGNNTITMIVTDSSGNIDSCQAIVNVMDIIPPTVLCHDTTLYIDTLGVLSVLVNNVDNGSFDNCSLDTLWLSNNSFNCTDTGRNAITLYARDSAGNVDSCSATITILDTNRPEAICMDTTVYLSGTGSFQIDSSFINNNSTSTCAISTIKLSQYNFNCIDVGGNLVSMYVTDENGNQDSCQATVTVIDTVPPVARCKNSTVYLNYAGRVGINNTYTNYGSLDNCGISLITLSDTSFNCGQLGANSVTMVVTDYYGNSDSCQSIITVLDTILPTAICTDTTVYINASGSYVITSSYINNGSFDNCGLDSIWLSNYTFNCTDIGNNLVKLYVKDSTGNLDSCQAVVTVVDTNSSIARCKDTTIYINGSAGFTIDSTYVNGNNGTGGCGYLSVVLSQYHFDCQDLGPNSVKMVVTDVNGNLDSCQAIVTVLDTNMPVANCRNITVYLDSSGSISIDSSDINNGSTNSCGLSSITLSQSNFDCSHIGPNIITMTVSDIAGNSDSCQSTVTVLDTMKPIVICKDTTIYMSNSGLFTITNSFVNNGTSDNCSLDSIWLSKYTFDCFDVGINVVQLYAIDSSGNMDSCSAIITINDTASPVAMCKDTTIYLSPGGSFTIDSTFINNNPSYGCDVAAMTLNQYIFDCSHLGNNPLTLVVSDFNGNMDSCSAVVTVLDTNRPVASCRNISVYLNAAGTAVIDSSDIDNGSSDNCQIVSMSLSQTTFNCFEVGNQNVTLIVTDQSGNSDTCQSTVIVIDSINPTPICMDTSIYLDSAGLVNISNNFIDNGTYDNCGLDSIWLSKYSFDCSNVGINSVTLYAVDSSGNLDSCSANITIIDTIDAGTFAGLDTNICGYGTIQLNGSPIPPNQSATWSVYSGPSSVAIANGTTRNPTASGLIIGSYNFIYSITKGLGCIIDRDTVQVNILDTLFALAGPDIDLCDQTNTNFLGTQTPYGISGTWSTMPGSPSVPSFADSSRANSNVSNLVDGVYRFMWTVSNGLCTDVYDTIVLTANDLPISNAGLDQNLCGIYLATMAGNPLSGRAKGVWSVLASAGSSAPIFSDSTNPVATVTGLVEGIYSFVWTVSNGSCPPSSDTIQINVYDPPTADAGADTLLCGIDSLNMYAQVPAGTSTGVWSAITALPMIVHNPVAAKSKVSSLGFPTLHTFLWTVSNGTCPAVNDTVEIQVLDQPIANAGPDSSYCDKSAVMLNATPVLLPSIGRWYLDVSSAPPNIPTFSDTLSPNPLVSGLIEGTYRFIWRAVNSPCFAASDTVEIKIYDQHFAIAGPDQSWCDQQSAILSSNAIVGTATAQWVVSSSSPNTPRFNPVLPYQQIDSFVSGGEYQMIWEISNGVCPVSRDTMTIFNHFVPNSNFAVDKDEVCQGDSVNFLCLSTIPAPDLLVGRRWDIVDSLSYGLLTSRVFNTPGYYGVQLISTSQYGCADTVKLDSVIYVHTNPIAGFSIDYISNTPRVDINDLSKHATNYTYKFGEGGERYSSNPYYSYRESGLYTIWQIVTNDFGCIDSTSNLIEIKLVRSYVPNAFTPDNDGINDIFVPVISEGDNPNYKFTIHNRWGELIFQSNELGKGWDGTYKGTKSQVGTYIWMLTTNTGPNEAPVDTQGFVNLIR